MLQIVGNFTHIFDIFLIAKIYIILMLQDKTVIRIIASYLVHIIVGKVGQLAKGAELNYRNSG